MLNDRDDKKYSQDDSEYHFSEDDLGYDIEPETPKSAPEKKDSLLNRLMELARKRRLLISVGVFVILMMIVILMMRTNRPQEIVPAPVLSAPSQQAPLTAAPPTPAAVALPTSPAPTQAPVAIPAVIPVEGQQAAAAPSPVGVVPSSQVESKMATLTKSNEELMGRLQLDYTQKISEVSAQNKFLQDEVRSLSTRVATLETQLNQVVQSLLKPNAANTRTQSSADPKITYTVQAIIPGRAWLRSESGDPITVTEGDMLKGVGRVTKINPYDGVVEINTGSKVVSLTYGSGS